MTNYKKKYSINNFDEIKLKTQELLKLESVNSVGITAVGLIKIFLIMLQSANVRMKLLYFRATRFCPACPKKSMRV